MGSKQLQNFAQNFVSCLLQLKHSGICGSLEFISLTAYLFGAISLGPFFLLHIKQVKKKIIFKSTEILKVLSKNIFWIV